MSVVATTFRVEDYRKRMWDHASIETREIKSGEPRLGHRELGQVTWRVLDFFHFFFIPQVRTTWNGGYSGRMTIFHVGIIETS